MRVFRAALRCSPAPREVLAKLQATSAMAWILTAALTGLLMVAWWLCPVLDHHEGTAAWVQAAGAIVIIGATAWIASQNSREIRERERIARQQLWESIAALARNCLGAIDTLLRKYPAPPSSDPRGNFLRAYTPTDFAIPIDGLAAIPLHQIGNAALITSVLVLRGVMGQIKKHLDDVLHNPIMSVDLQLIRNHRTPAFNAVADVLRIVKGPAAEEELSRLAQ